jgi:hypothetical protein
MDMTQTVSNSTVAPHQIIDAVTDDGPGPLSTVWIDLKPERVQDTLVAGGGVATLSLQVAIHQPQTVTFSLAGLGLAISFNSNDGGAAPAA